MNLDAGRIVAVNAEVENAQLLDDQEHVCAFLDQLIPRIKMVVLNGPTIVRVPINDKAIGEALQDDGGLTVQYVISTSHIAYHSWPTQHRFRLVVDSCQNFESDDVVAWMLAAFFPVKKYLVSVQDYVPPKDVRDHLSARGDYVQETQQAQEDEKARAG